MALKARFDDDLKTALLAGDKFRAQTLRGLKAAILNEEVATGNRESGLDDAVIEIVLAREVKKRRESVALYEQNDRAELAADEQHEIDILSEYLPKQLNEDEIQTVVTETIATLGVSGPQAMGQVIGAVKGKLGTAADGATVARLVKDSLQ